MFLFNLPNNKIQKLFIATAVFAACAHGPAYAMVPDSATSIANPARVEQGFNQPEDVPKLSPKVQVDDVILQKVPEGAENIKFELASIQFDGLTVFTPEELTSVYENKLGTTISLADVYGIATSLTTKYRNSGYILTQVVVPPQTIESGTVRLRVVEGFIENITVEGEESESSLNEIRGFTKHIKTGKALNVKDLERVLLLINDLPGVTARSILSPSQTPGASDLRIIINRDRYEGLISADNYGSRFIGPVQFSGAATSNNFFGNNESITGQIVLAPGRQDWELAYAAINYRQPINTHGTNLQFFYSETHTEPGFGLEIFEVEGESAFYSLRLEHPFIRTRTENLNAYAIFDWRDLESKSLISSTLEDNIRALRIGGRYDFLDTLIGVGVNSINLELSKGLNVFGNSDQGDLFLTRNAGDPTFFKANANIQRLQRVTNGVNLLLEAKGQWSATPLLSSEEFGVGGINLGRAYDASEIIGDDGIAGKAELQWNDPYKFDWQYLEDYQLFGFYDAGTIWEQDASTSKLKQDTITSAGFGIRADFTGAEMDFTVAFPLNRSIQTQGDENPRVFVSLSKRF